MTAAMPNRNFATLDAIRGIAAICVMGFHYALLDESIPIKFSNAFIDVDLFFCLSGFVLMQAYGRWAGSSKSIFDFLKIRVIRLYPMYIMGTIFGIAAYLMTLTNFQQDSVGRLILSILLSIFMLPDLSGTVYINFSITNGIYPFNVPAWSLFFEILANITLVARRWNNASLLSLIAIAGVALVAVSVAMRTVNGGFEASTVIIGLLRMSYNFAVGALLMNLFQRGFLKRVALPPALPILCVIVISAILPASGKLDIAIILIVIPLIISCATWDPRSRWALAACAWLGRISYPLYAIHYPIVLLAMQTKGLHVDQIFLIGYCAVFAIVLSDILSRTLDPMARRVLYRAFIERPGSALTRSPEWAKKF